MYDTLEKKIFNVFVCKNILQITRGKALVTSYLFVDLKHTFQHTFQCDLCCKGSLTTEYMQC